MAEDSFATQHLAMAIVLFMVLALGAKHILRKLSIKTFHYNPAERGKKGEGMMYQQGDVLLTKVSGVKGGKLGHLTLAKGEHTGHHHTITEGEAELYLHEGTLFLRVNSDEAKLTHQEHGCVVLPKGDYQVGIVKEYSHFDEEAKNVQD